MPTNITKKLITLWLFLIIFTLAMPLAVFAVDGSTVPAKQKCLGGTEHNFCLNIQIGRLDGFDVVAGSSIMGDYIKSWYGFLLGTVGILATIMIMWGGFKYLVSRGDKASIESAKTQMISAVTGIVLAFGTYTLLYLINPALLTINTPNLPGIQGGGNIDLSKVTYTNPATNQPINPAELAAQEPGNTNALVRKLSGMTAGANLGEIAMDMDLGKEIPFQASATIIDNQNGTYNISFPAETTSQDMLTYNNILIETLNTGQQQSGFNNKLSIEPSYGENRALIPNTFILTVQ